MPPPSPPRKMFSEKMQQADKTSRAGSSTSHDPPPRYPPPAGSAHNPHLPPVGPTIQKHREEADAEAMELRGKQVTLVHALSRLRNGCSSCWVRGLNYDHTLSLCISPVTDSNLLGSWMAGVSYPSSYCYTCSIPWVNFLFLSQSTGYLYPAAIDWRLACVSKAKGLHRRKNHDHGMLFILCFKRNNNTPLPVRTRVRSDLGGLLHVSELAYCGKQGSPLEHARPICMASRALCTIIKHVF